MINNLYPIIAVHYLKKWGLNITITSIWYVKQLMIEVSDIVNVFLGIP